MSTPDSLEAIDEQVKKLTSVKKKLLNLRRRALEEEADDTKANSGFEKASLETKEEEEEKDEHLPHHLMALKRFKMYTVENPLLVSTSGPLRRVNPVPVVSDAATEALLLAASSIPAERCLRGGAPLDQECFVPSRKISSHEGPSNTHPRKEQTEQLSQEEERPNTEEKCSQIVPEEEQCTPSETSEQSEEEDEEHEESEEEEESQSEQEE